MPAKPEIPDNANVPEGARIALIFQILVGIQPVGLERLGFLFGSRFREIAHRLGGPVFGPVRRRHILGFGTGFGFARALQIHDLGHS